MEEKYLNKLLDYQDYCIRDYDINNNYVYYKDRLEEIIQIAIEEEKTRSRNQYKFPNPPLAQTDEEKLDSMDLAVIEKYLRKKKLVKLNEPTK